MLLFFEHVYFRCEMVCIDAKIIYMNKMKWTNECFMICFMIEMWNAVAMSKKMY